MILHFRTRKIKWWPQTCGWSRWVHQNVFFHVPFQFCDVNSPSFVTALLLAGVARLQAALGPPGIWKRHIHPNPLGAYLETRYCPLQQVSVSVVPTRQTRPCKFSLPVLPRCFLQLFLLILFSVVEFHVDSHNIRPRCALNDMINICHKVFVLPSILSLDSGFCWGMPGIVFSSHVGDTIELDLCFQLSLISLCQGALP